MSIFGLIDLIYVLALVGKKLEELLEEEEEDYDYDDEDEE